ncbi:MAG: 30S ribosomal protein S14, small subunit ribosomal protein S14 [Candidatus Peregrinibacteria bacterium GW2011_GWE2_39_6]|nr:MAG: 30S ribosomal protein S14, small subunit ribosomal protein S14 [Candidatus Peregrinibacteria bacterium GW2011_GWF2_39_17]KKR26546.1 MAG: 30S ribosomal protein S14, small subunit ribosomal protein S14 [Candidatus Peregrinibacteria bacterium GW2011_GWE2_39_6]
MARTALIVKTERKKKEFMKSLQSGKAPHRPTQVYNRCQRCGKVRSYMRRFGLCRICVRELASQGMIMGLKKSSW